MMPNDYGQFEYSQVSGGERIRIQRDNSRLYVAERFPFRHIHVLLYSTNFLKRRDMKIRAIAGRKENPIE